MKKTQLMRLRDAENAFLRCMGWTPIDEWSLDGVWRDPTAESQWDRHLAVERAKEEAEREDK